MANVFVGNLSFDTTVDSLQGLVSSLSDGENSNVQLQLRDNGKSKGWALVSFDTDDAANNFVEKAMGMSHDDRKLNVRLDRGASKPRRTNTQQPRRQRNTRPTPKVDNTDNTNCYVGNLPWSYENNDLNTLFENFSISSSQVVMGNNGRSRGYALVEFASNEEAQKGIEAINGTSIEGRNIVVRFDYKSGQPQEDQSANVNKNSLYVGNLPWTTIWQELKTIFAEYNPGYAEVKTGKDGRSKGFGIVKFDEEGVAEQALTNFANFELEGRQLEIRFDRGK